MQAASRNRRFAADERGLTLTELVVVGVLATMVMLALTGFYFNSQNMWIAGSTQAMAQRDATLLVETLRSRVHEAKTASIDTSDPQCNVLTLGYVSGDEVDFHRNSGDGRVHMYTTKPGGSAGDDGAIIDTPVTRFQLTTVGANMVDLTLLELKSANGDSVRITSQFQLLGQ